MRLLVEALGLERFDWDRAAALPEGRRLVVVLPAFNEAGNVGPVVSSLPVELDGMRVIPIVVSDGSRRRDGVRSPSGGCLRHRAADQPRRGPGPAGRLRHRPAPRCRDRRDHGRRRPAPGRGAAGDGRRRSWTDSADYVNGSRLLGDFERDSLIRHIGVHVFSRIVSILTGRRITDPSSGYRAARADLLHRSVLEQDQFWTSEILIEALRHRARVVEVPVTIVARASGASKKPAVAALRLELLEGHPADLAAMTFARRAQVVREVGGAYVGVITDTVFDRVACPAASRARTM